MSVRAHLILGGIVLGAFACATLRTPEPATIEEAGLNRISLYVTTHGIRVTIGRLAGAKDNPYLVYVRGSDSDIEGIVYPAMKAEIERDLVGYRAQVDGRARHLVVIQRPKSTTKGDEVLLQLPARRIPLEPREAGMAEARQLLRLHREQLANGALARAQAFERARWQATQETRFASAARTMNAACGGDIRARVVWESVDDQIANRSRGVSRLCESFMAGLRTSCQSAVAADIIRRRVRAADCQLGSERELTFQDGVLSLTVAEDSVNVAETVTSFLGHSAELSTPSLVELARLEASSVCIAEDGTLVGLVATEAGEQVVYGSAERLVRVPAHAYVPGNHFFEPREVRTKAGSVRGADMRFFSAVTVSGDGCMLRCGERRVELQLLAPKRAREILSSAELAPNPFDRLPYAVARSRTGRYYFVDIGNEKDAKDYRVFAGPRGNLEELRMTNVVSDSEGHVFETRTGNLRLVLEKRQAFWIAGRKTTTLTNVPIEDNVQLVYVGLGVYAERPFGTPCDTL